MKRIFEGTNYNNGPYAVGMFWATKFVMRLRGGDRVRWYTDSVEAVDEFTTDLNEIGTSSPLIAALLVEPVQCRPYAIRSIRSVMRERVSIERADWVLVEQGGVRVVARVRDMMECLLQQGDQVLSVVRLWCDSCVEPRQGAHGELWAPHGQGDSTALIKLEEVHIAVKSRNSHAQHDVYT